MIIRVLLVLGLVYFTVKPYLDKPREDDSARQTFKIVGKTMGTQWHAAIVSSSARLVKLNYESDSGKNKQLLDQPEDEIIDSCEALLSRIVQRELDKIDASASTYRADSEVSRFNRSKSTDWFPVSEDLAKMVSIAQDVSAKTDGAFDITVAPLVDLYRFGPNKSALVSFPTDEEINALRSRVGYDKLQVRFEPEPALKNRLISRSISPASLKAVIGVVANALEEIEDSSSTSAAKSDAAVKNSTRTLVKSKTGLSASKGLKSSRPRSRPAIFLICTAISTSALKKKVAYSRPAAITITTCKLAT